MTHVADPLSVLKNNHMKEDIWKQPAEGFTDESIGRTEEQIVQKETEIGFKFPNLYREHMKIQNGGYLWKSALVYNGEVKELFLMIQRLTKLSIMEVIRR